MKRVVLLDATGTPSFVDDLRAIWANGDAALPIDPRWPAPARAAAIAAAHLEVPTLSGDALVITTSGTSGDPKAVVLTYDAIEASARETSRRLEIDPTADHWLACLPLAHIGGLSVVLRALMTGTPVTVHGRFDPRAADDAAAEGATRVSLVPTALRRIDSRSWRTILLGGQAPPEDRPTNVIATYGMTETGSGVVYEGRPLDGVEADASDGELRLRGPMLLRAYRAAGSPVGVDPKDAGGWFATGDLGRVDADGTVIVEGRRGDLIITGGENVWPTAVERVLAGHPGIEDVAVVGRADAEWGQVVTALVVATDLTAPPLLDELRDHVKRTLPAYAAPRALELVESLPRTVGGKLRRRDLRGGG